MCCRLSYIIIIIPVLRQFSTLKRGLDVTNKLTLVLHKGLFCASSIFNPHSFMSFFTHSIHVFLPLSFFAPPTTSKFLHLETQSSASLRSTCQNHLSLPRLTTFSTPSIPSPSLSSSLGLLSFRVTPDQ